MALPSFPTPQGNHEPEELTPGPNLYLVSDYQRPTSILALTIFGLGLLLGVVLIGRAPALSGLSVVLGIVLGGIMNAPAGVERRKTVAALGLPTLGLLLITAIFVASV